MTDIVYPNTAVMYPVEQEQPASLDQKEGRGGVGENRTGRGWKNLRRRPINILDYCCFVGASLVAIGTGPPDLSFSTAGCRSGWEETGDWERDFVVLALTSPPVCGGRDIQPTAGGHLLWRLAMP